MQSPQVVESVLGCRDGNCSQFLHTLAGLQAPPVRDHGMLARLLLHFISASAAGWCFCRAWAYKEAMLGGVCASLGRAC